MSRLKVALLGVGRRMKNLYLPLLADFDDLIEIVSVWSRSDTSASKLASACGVPGYTSLEKLVEETRPDIGIVSVSYSANGRVGIAAAKLGIHLLLETPIAHNLEEAREIIGIAKEQKRLVEVAEQNPFKPQVHIMQALLDSGRVGKLLTACSDQLTQGYHGISVVRRHIGFDVAPTKVAAIQREYPLQPYKNRFSGELENRSEQQQYASIDFENGMLGLFSWSTLGWPSPARWWKSSRLMTDKGMLIAYTVGDEAARFHAGVSDPDREGTRMIAIERIAEEGALKAMTARFDDKSDVIAQWENPFFGRIRSSNSIWDDDKIGVAHAMSSLVNGISEAKPLRYGADQALLDQKLHLSFSGEYQGDW